MKTTIAWLNDALATKDIGVGMTYYRCKKGIISATDGRITASHPWSFGGEFLVPGKEFEKILDRLPEGKTKLTVANGSLKLAAGRFHGTIETLPLSEWDHPGVDDAKWKKLPVDLIPIIKALRPFLAEDGTQAWLSCIALQDGWAFATNNIAIAGAPCKGLEKINALLPVWAIDFILGRQDELDSWAVSDNYIAFRWKNGAWMRSQLIVGKFPEKAATLVQGSQKASASFKINDEFREAFGRVAELAEDTIELYADHIQSKFGKAMISDGITCKTPKGEKCSIWGARFLMPALAAANAWAPEAWPEPAVFKGPVVSGYVVGRRAS